MTAIYNKIGDNYDTTRKADPEITATLANLLHIQKGKHYLEDFFLYSGKQRPEIYLLETVRNGISSFKNFCTHTELQQGLTKLDGDIQSGAIYNLINQFHHDGDYLFLMAKKS